MASIWVLTGAKMGDNAQVLRAAHAIGLPFEIRKITVKPEWEFAKPKVSPSLHHIDSERSDPLSAPWPDVVITIGRRLSLAALWIKQQSGGKTAIALFNAPKGSSDGFDLLVVPQFYQIKDGPNVLRIGLPLIAADPARIAVAGATYADSLGAMPRPLNVLLLGGDMGKNRLEARFAADVVRQMRQSFAKTGSIFVSTSRRTSNEAANAVARELLPGDGLYRWSEGATDNPYFGLLAHGDSFTVTHDSLSMLTEVARLGRPLAIAEPSQPSLLGRAIGYFTGSGVRDLAGAADFLVRGGHAVRLGSPLPRTPVLPADDTQKVAERLRQLVLRRD